MNNVELLSYLPGDTFFFDIEVYPNFFLAAFMHEITEKTVLIGSYEDSGLNKKKLMWMLNRFRIISFNGLNFDMPLTNLAIYKNVNCATLSNESRSVINDDLRKFMFYKKHKLKEVNYDHIDLIEVAPLQASLKLYGARLGAKKIQDLPYSPEQNLTYTQMLEVCDYCENDLRVTKLLWNSLQDAIKLREELGSQYGVDLRSKSNAQCAEAIFKKLTGAKPTGVTEGSFLYEPPPYIRFIDEGLCELLVRLGNEPFVIDKDGKVKGPECITGKKRMSVGGKPYTVGIGGLHSNEKSVWYKSDDQYQLYDYDVASYYPRAIDKQEIIPPAIGEAFLPLYRGLIASRLQDKANGLKRRANAKKIIINGTFGKLRNKHSIFFYPKGFIQVTMTGQLCLLMLIEGLTRNGIDVVSANTDGIVLKCHNDKVGKMESIISSFQNVTGFELESTKYEAIYIRDVNNYIAIKNKNEVKNKGAFSWKDEGAEESLSKNPKAAIIAKAVISFLQDGTPLQDTILNSKNVLDFCIVRSVTGGAEKDGGYLGKTVRFYYDTEAEGQLSYVKNGNKVPESHGAFPLMELPDNISSFFQTIDYRRYIDEAMEALVDLGVNPKPTKTRKARNKKIEG